MKDTKNVEEKLLKIEPVFVFKEEVLNILENEIDEKKKELVGLCKELDRTKTKSDGEIVEEIKKGTFESIIYREES